MTSKKRFTFQKRQDSSSCYHCCVPSCTASAKFNSALSFFTFPKDVELRKKWLINIRRDQFEWNNYSLPAPRPGVWKRRERPEPPLANDAEDDLPMDVACPEHDCCSSAEPAALDLALSENVELRSELAALRRQMEEMSISSKFGLERFAGSDEDIRLYTR
ncbi:hypothetical protein WMY93_011268 [Mugilogobius chulae]|uniref:THAP-type domain-containing protein n=1 Tax=Mugilogobius chulae TaxID=88201 RepID=A0AAW0P1H9_9GOBI